MPKRYLRADINLQLNLGRMFLAVVAITAVIVVPVPAASQDVMMNADHYGGILHATAARPSFEVASIRPSAPNAESRYSGISMYPDRIGISGFSIKDVIEFAYAVPNENELSGGPSWIRTEKFDITGKPAEAVALVLRKLSPPDLHVQMRLMVQSLLEERLRLNVSFAKKDRPSFALVVAKGGFKCTKAAPDTTAGTIPPPPPPAGNMPSAAGREETMHWAAQRLPFSLIVAWITQQSEVGGRIVVDKTGLNGNFSCDVSWAREGVDFAGPSFFTAIQEQMGLKLQPEHGPVETIVIDHVEQPSEN